MEYTVKKIQDLKSVGQELLLKFPDARVFAIYGNMGAGKTTFIQQLCELLDVKSQVVSPTFTIINEYPSGKVQLVYHFDFYRIKDENEYLALGCNEYFYSGNYCFIEWPEVADSKLPHNMITVKINEFDGIRVIEF